MKYQCNECYSNVPCVIDFNIRMPSLSRLCPFALVKEAKWEECLNGAKNTEQQVQADSPNGPTA